MGKSVPIINQWYQDIAVNRLFEVIAIDEYSALINIRYTDPDREYGVYEDSGLDEISFDDWTKMIVVPAREPEDWRSSFGTNEDTRMLVDDIIMPNSDTSSLESIQAADYLFGWDEF